MCRHLRLLPFILALWTTSLPTVHPQLTLEDYEDLTMALNAAAGSEKHAGDTCDVHLGDTLLALMKKYGGKTPQQMRKVDDLAAALGTDVGTQIGDLRTNSAVLQKFTHALHDAAHNFCPVEKQMICAGNLCHECKWLHPTDDSLTRRCEEVEVVSKKFGEKAGTAGKVGGAADLIGLSFGILFLLT